MKINYLKKNWILYEGQPGNKVENKVMLSFDGYNFFILHEKKNIKNKTLLISVVNKKFVNKVKQVKYKRPRELNKSSINNPKM